MRAELKRIFGDRVSFQESERKLYSRDLAVLPDVLGLGMIDLLIERVPDAVVKPNSTEEVQEVARLSARELIPLTPRGAATGGVGGAVPTKKGIVVDLLRMNRILEVDRENLTVTVEAGIIWEGLEEELNAQGLACRALPSSAPSSTVGGWIASSGVGHGSFEYGAIDKNVAAVELVVPNGEVWELEGDQLKMVLGAYGITGFITKATLKVRELDETVPVEIEFDSIPNMDSALREIIGTIPIWTLNVEMDDFVALKNAALGKPMTGAHHALLIGIPRSRYDPEAFKAVAAKHNGRLHLDAQEAWEGRYLPLRIKKLGPSVVTGEVYVPTSRMFEYLEVIYKKLKGETFGVEATLANDEEVAVRIYVLVDERDVGGMNYMSSWSIPIKMLKIARKFGGRTYQTGLFLGKEAQNYFGRERLKRIFAFKRSVDPEAMMNPGKIYLHYRYAMIFGIATPFMGMLGGRSTQKAVPPEEVHARLTDYMEHIYTCVSCAYCRDGCPVYTERGWESAAPKGKMVFAKEYMESRTDVDEYMYKRIFECTLCGQCQEVCQAEIPLCDVWTDMRAKFWELGYEPMEAHVMMQDSLRAEGNPFNEPASRRDELFPEDAVGLIREGDDREPDILVWAGCVNSYQDIKTLPAFMKVLDAAGVTYTSLGTEEGCCGYVAHITGMPAFHDLAHGAAERINECGAPIIVTPCAGCDKAFAKIYPEHGIEVVPEALHGVQYLDRLIQEGRLKPERPFKKRVTWHDPCDIGRHLRIFDEPRRILRSIPELDFVEMPTNREKATCCGGGGGLKASDLDLSSDIALRRVKEALSVGAEVIVSSCPSCKANLKIAADRARKEKLGKVQVMDINELLVRTLPKEPRE